MANSITKVVLIETLMNKFRLEHYQAKAFVDDFFEELSHVIETKGALNLSGFGSFSVKEKGQRPGRNPKTGEEYAIDSRRVVSFKVGSTLKGKLLSIKNR